MGTSFLQPVCLMAIVCLYLSLTPPVTFSLEDKAVFLGAFNIKRFNMTKSEDHKVVETIARISARYDIVLLTEFQDDNHRTVVNRLWKEINKTGVEFNVTASDKLGRYPDFYTEEYVFFYRPSKVVILDTYQYDDMPENSFEREPYAILINHPGSLDPRQNATALIASHIQPKNAENELLAMKEVVETVKAHWSVDRIVVLGDLNADCSFMSEAQLQATPLRNSSTYNWLIPDEADTTVSWHSHCAYDRIIVTNNVQATNSGVFQFDDYYSLTFWQAWNTSDHYPVETTLYLEYKTKQNNSLGEEIVG